MSLSHYHALASACEDRFSTQLRKVHTWCIQREGHTAKTQSRSFAACRPQPCPEYPSTPETLRPEVAGRASARQHRRLRPGHEAPAASAHPAHSDPHSLPSSPRATRPRASSSTPLYENRLALEMFGISALGTPARAALRKHRGARELAALGRSQKKRLFPGHAVHRFTSLTSSPEGRLPACPACLAAWPLWRPYPGCSGYPGAALAEPEPRAWPLARPSPGRSPLRLPSLPRPPFAQLQSSFHHHICPSNPLALYGRAAGRGRAARRPGKPPGRQRRTS